MNYKRPVLLVGNGARAAGAAPLIVDFFNKTHIPVLTTMNAVDLAQDDMQMGFIGTYGNRISNMIISSSDLVISVGARLGLRQIGHKPEWFAPQAHLIRADIDQYELSRNVKDNEEKHLMDAYDFMNYLLSEDYGDYTDWFNRCVKAKNLIESIDDTEGNRIVKKISSLLPNNPIVTVDVGQHECWCAQSLHLKGNEGRILIGGGYGSMGCSLPYAIGASIATGKCFCITGDGGLQMNIQELEVVVREQLPIKIFVINNHVLGKISEIQHVSYNDRYAQTTAESGYSVPNFEKIAQAYGIRAATMDSYEKLDDYKGWLEDDKPCLLDIYIPAKTLLIPKIKWETGTIKPDIPESLLQQVNSLLYD